MPTDFAALDALYPLPPEELFRQWMLIRDPAAIPAGWDRRAIGGWHLGSHPDAHVCDLHASDGTPIGWLIEPIAYLEDTGGVVPAERLTLPANAQCTPAAIEQALYGRDELGRSDGRGVEGMWVAIILGGSSEVPLQRVYLGAAHSVVYDREKGAVATTHNLIPGVRRNEALSRAFDPLQTNSYFTFGLTAFLSVHRLLPNHYLDLGTFHPVRHWPVAAWEPWTDGAEGAAAIVEHTRRFLRTLCTRFNSFRVFLSAGRDSRAILACLQPLVREGVIDVLLATTVGHDVESRTDLQAARRLARISGLPHDINVRQRHSSSASEVLRAFARIGESKSGPILSAPGLTQRSQNAGSPRFTLAGMAGETGRSFYWGANRPRYRRLHSSAVTPQLLARVTQSPTEEAVLQAADAWLKGLPQHVRASAADTLDLAYVEQRLGCWESSTRYLFPGRPRLSSPMAAAFNIEAMLRLPEDYRAARMLQHDMVAFGWPELLAVPFNRPTGLLRLSWYARKGGRILRGIRHGLYAGR